MNKTDKLIRNNDVITADMNGCAVTMDMKTGKYYNMGTIGTVIWKKLENEITYEKLISEVSNEYDISYELCEKDSASFINDLVGRKLIEVNK